MLDSCQVDAMRCPTCCNTKPYLDPNPFAQTETFNGQCRSVLYPSDPSHPTPDILCLPAGSVSATQAIPGYAHAIAPPRPLSINPKNSIHILVLVILKPSCS